MARRRQFTLEEAQGLVPWLTERFESLRSLQHRLQDCSARLEELGRRIRSNGGSNLEDAVAAKHKEAEALTGQLRRTLEEIGQRGIIVRDPQTGLVDFPSIREGREVFLCWRLGEGRIGYWHETTTGYSGRQPL